MLPYAYRPLLPAANSVRLVQILPGAPGSHVYCRLIDYTIPHAQTSGPFEALSYVWGDPSVTLKIYITATAVPSEPLTYINVTENLFAALQRLRDAVLPRTMWIDALCINQVDLDERASQVKFMARIYSHALRVTVWLGEGHDDAQAVFPAIQHAANHVQSIRTRTIPTIHESSAHRESSLGGLQRAFDEERAYRKTSVPEAALLAFLARPWFSRIWILQEAAAATSLVLVCGDLEIPGSTFAKGLQVLSELMYPSQSLGLAKTIAQIIDLDGFNAQASPARSQPDARSHPNDPRSHPNDPRSHPNDPRSHPNGPRSHPNDPRGSVLGELVERFRNQDATDQRDKVFALLGMASDGTADLLAPDYTKGWGAVFAHLARHVLGPSATVFTWNTAEHALVTVQGCALGLLEKSDSPNYWTMRFLSPGIEDLEDGPVYWWPDAPYCKDLQTGDVVFLARHAKRPTLIRLRGTYFDVIVAAMQEPFATIPFHQQNSVFVPETTLDWSDLISGVAHDQYQVTMVWDWSVPQKEADSNSPHDTHLVQLLDAHIPRESRVYNNARLLDNICPTSVRTRLLADRVSFQTRTHGTETTPLQVLYTMWSNSYSYTWLQHKIQQLRWFSWYLLQPSMPYIEMTMAYWRERGYLNQDWVTIKSFLDIDIGTTPSESDSRQDKLIFIDLHEPRNDELYSALFPPQLHPRSASDNNIAWPQGSVTRYLVKIVLARFPLALENSAASIRTLITHPSRTRVAKIIALALISEARGNVLSLTREDLIEASKLEESPPMFHSLLGLLYKDVSSAYNIFATVIYRAFEAIPKIPSNLPTIWHSWNADVDTTELLITHFGKRRLEDEEETEASRMFPTDDGQTIIIPSECDNRIHFFDRSVPTLRNYIEHTNLYEYAASIEGDLLLPCLHKRYTARLRNYNGECSREALLRYLTEYEKRVHVPVQMEFGEYMPDTDDGVYEMIPQRMLF
ncbi:het domain protein [Stagonosporopsis vannaccii]|nr:het domain protein [Stagonosporopsis vannaccii]